MDKEELKELISESLSYLDFVNPDDAVDYLAEYNNENYLELNSADSEYSELNQYKVAKNYADNCKREEQLINLEESTPKKNSFVRAR
jgi:hypothetical protein